MTEKRSDHDEVGDALRARQSLAHESYSPAELLEGGAGRAEHVYEPVVPLDEGQELAEESGSDGL